MKVSPPESIETPRLLLRRPLLSESDEVFRWASDPEVTQFMDWPTPASVGDIRHATEAAILDWERGVNYSWRICIKPSSAPVGSVACSIANQTANFGLVLSRAYWGNQYGSEAAKAILEWAMSEKAINRIEATCDIENFASARVLEKIGMVRECVVEKFAVRPNLPGKPLRDALMFAMTKED